MSVLVLGGGPAGSAAALTLLAAGVEVTIVERSQFPRFRPGETLHPGVEPILQRLRALTPIIDGDYLRHAGHWVEWAGPAHFVAFGHGPSGPWRGFQVPRTDLDQHLLSRALHQGARVFLGRAATSLRVDKARVIGVDTTQGSLSARLVIDCSGGHRCLARQLGIRMRRYSPPLMARFGYATGRPAEVDRLPLMQSDARGWTWISEVGPERFHWTRVTLPHDRPPGDWIPSSLRGCAPEPSRGADVTWRIAGQTAGLGWFLAGDAAALLDPSSSHGVLRALMTGMMAGRLAARALQSPALEAQCARAYHEWLLSWFESDAAQLVTAYRRARLFGLGERVGSGDPERRLPLTHALMGSHVERGGAHEPGYSGPAFVE